MSCRRSFGAAEFLDFCPHGLIVLLLGIWQVAVCFGLMSLTSWIWVGGLVPRKCIFCLYKHSYNFYPAHTVKLRIDREGTAKSQDGQQKRNIGSCKA